MRLQRSIWRLRRHGEEGFALATVVALSFIVIMVVTAVFTIQLANIAETRRSAGQLEGRSQSDSVLDQTFTQLVNTDVNNPTIRRPRGVNADVGNWDWYGVSSGGEYKLCTAANGFSPSSVCMHWAMVEVGPSDVIIEVTTRSRCTGEFDSTTSRMAAGARCVVTKYQQRMRKKQYFDYLFFTETETLSPLWGGGPVVWSKNDVLNGPVRTDGQFSICNRGGKPWFKQGLYAVTQDFLAPCEPSATVYVGDPTRASKTSAEQVQRLDLPASTTLFRDLVIAAGETVYTSADPLESPQVELFDNGTYSVTNGAGTVLVNRQLLPPSRVLYFEGIAPRVYGTLSGRLTIATGGGANILINGNLTYACLGETDLNRRTAMRNGTFDSNCGDALGLIADRNIHITCSVGSTNAGTFDTTASLASGAAGPACLTGKPTTTDHRFLVGALLALGNCTGSCDSGLISLEKWASAGPNAGVMPNLYFYGSMASRYRPVFGVTESSTGNTIRGLGKNFTFDDRLKNRQPPYFLEPTNAQWERVDLTEVTPCAAGLNNQRPQGAGCP